jgi:hypothetical protein
MCVSEDGCAVMKGGRRETVSGREWRGRGAEPTTSLHPPAPTSRCRRLHATPSRPTPHAYTIYTFVEDRVAFGRSEREGPGHHEVSRGAVCERVREIQCAGGDEFMCAGPGEWLRCVVVSACIGVCFALTLVSPPLSRNRFLFEKGGMQLLMEEDNFGVIL